MWNLHFKVSDYSPYTNPGAGGAFLNSTDSMNESSHHTGAWKDHEVSLSIPLSDTSSMLEKAGIDARIEEILPSLSRGKSKCTETSVSSTAMQLHQSAKLQEETAWDPQTADMMRVIVRSNDAATILSAIRNFLPSSTPLVLSSALSKLSRTINSTNRCFILQSADYQRCLASCSERLEDFDGTSLARSFLALLKMKESPSWIKKLILLSSEKVEEMDFRQYVGYLSAILRLDSRLTEIRELRSCLLANVKKRLMETTETDQITKLIIALGWAHSVDVATQTYTVQKVLSIINQLNGSELADIIRSLGNLKVREPNLGRIMRDAVSKTIQDCGISEIIKITGGLTRMNAGEPEFFRLFVAPSIRIFVPQMKTSEIGIIIASYARLGFSDPDLFYDLARYLQPKIPNLLSSELAEITHSFAELSFENKPFYDSLKTQAIKLVDSFTNTCLIKTIYAFSMSGINDAKLFSILCDKAIGFLPTLRKFYVLRLLSALHEIEYLSHPIVRLILEDLQKAPASDLYAEECVEILRIISKLNPVERNTSYNAQLFSAILQRETTWNCLTADRIADLLEAMHDLGHYDKEILAMIQRRLHRYLARSGSIFFFRLLGGLSCLPYEERHAIRAHMHRRPGVLQVLMRRIGEIVYEMDDLNDKIILLYGLARLGMENDATVRLRDDVQYQIESRGQETTIPLFCYLVWSLVEMKSEEDWVRSLLKRFLSKRYEKKEIVNDNALRQSEGMTLDKVIRNEENEKNQANVELFVGRHEEAGKEEAEALLLLAWSCIFLGESDFLVPLLEEIASAFGELLPTEMLPAQQIALHFRQLSSSLNEPMSPMLKKWLDDVSTYTRQDLHKRTPAFGKLNNKYMGYISPCYRWISDALLKVGVPHFSEQVIANTYCVAAAFPTQGLLLDVLTFMDLKVPESSTSVASADMRQRQLCMLGWGVHSMSCKDFILAHRDGRVQKLIGNIVASFSPDATITNEENSSSSNGDLGCPNMVDPSLPSCEKSLVQS
ncbi:hypothetical protein IE077_002261 [Cardiosporidium cionae]|uniref:RNA-editing substrate-binding complex 6 protein domain-containing protein n=1 Tax=Cardiosporidium cionae TaxID=476202 RepID=A0ABQ7JBA4_9APIC|nr:hypothetical protein IE077_002261 [Cardiosporidium cionae]|eukprot:KAF8821251.1 hypothetical protein IE077_002261 [Cardiosporidium cionae]